LTLARSGGVPADRFGQPRRAENRRSRLRLRARSRWLMPLPAARSHADWPADHRPRLPHRPSGGGMAPAQPHM